MEKGRIEKNKIKKQNILILQKRPTKQQNQIFPISSQLKKNLKIKKSNSPFIYKTF